MTEEEIKSRRMKLLFKIILILAILILILLFPANCSKKEKAPAPPPAAVEEVTEPVLPTYLETDEHPLKLSESFKRLAGSYRANILLTYAVFDNWPNIREDLVNWSESSAGTVLYELVLPDGRTYALPEAFHGKLMVVFDDRALAEKFVSENKLSVEKGVSIRAIIPEKEQGGEE